MTIKELQSILKINKLVEKINLHINLINLTIEYNDGTEDNIYFRINRDLSKYIDNMRYELMECNEELKNSYTSSLDSAIEELVIWGLNIYENEETLNLAEISIFKLSEFLKLECYYDNKEIIDSIIDKYNPLD